MWLRSLYEQRSVAGAAPEYKGVWQILNTTTSAPSLFPRRRDFPAVAL